MIFKKIRTAFFIILSIGILLLIYFYFFIFYNPASNFENIEPDYILSGKNLFNSYKNNRQKADENYTGKIIQIKGNLFKLEDYDTSIVAFFKYADGDFGEEGIRCTMLQEYNNEMRKFIRADFLRIKGYCSGFNAPDVIMNKCSIVPD